MLTYDMAPSAFYEQGTFWAATGGVAVILIASIATWASYRLAVLGED